MLTTRDASIIDLAFSHQKINSNQFSIQQNHSFHPYECTLIAVSHAAFLFQIFTWRPSRTKDMHSTRPWGWEVWEACNAASTLAGAPTASPGPLITETAGRPRPISDLSAVFGSW
ncbi:hypothetical protein JTB14_037796 [Gonioctena quinquepunctata]|nr:hypothetical protein JTB14_037796 [Gonioctena quinquepunctata]